MKIGIGQLYAKALCLPFIIGGALPFINPQYLDARATELAQANLDSLTLRKSGTIAEGTIIVDPSSPISDKAILISKVPGVPLDSPITIPVHTYLQLGATVRDARVLPNHRLLWGKAADQDCNDLLALRKSQNCHM